MATLALMLGMGAFFAALIASRRMKERAFSQLDDAQKLAVLDSFAKRGSLQLIPLVVLVVIYLGVSQFMPDANRLVTLVFWLGLLLFGGISIGLNTRRLLTLDLPRSYTRSWLLGRAMMLSGVLAMMAGLYVSSVR